jgi:hypothetical protein
MILNEERARARVTSDNPPLELVRTVARHMFSVRIGLVLAAVLVVLSFATFITFIFYEDSTSWLDWIIVPIWMATWIFGAVGLLFLRDLFRASKAFGSWEAKYRQYALLASFEFMNTTDASPGQDVVNRLQTAYPDLEEEVSHRRARTTMPGTVSGKQKPHTFDIAIETKSGKLWLVKFRDDGAPEMSLDELKSLDDELRDIDARRRHYRIEAIIVSGSDFSDETVGNVRDAAKWNHLKKARVYEVLVRKTTDGLFVVSS